MYFPLALLWSESFMLTDYRPDQFLQYEYIVSEDFSWLKFLIYNDDIKIDFISNLSYISFGEFQVYYEQDGYFEPLPNPLLHNH